MKLVHPWENVWSLPSSETLHTVSWATDCTLFCKWIKCLQQNWTPTVQFSFMVCARYRCLSWMEFWKTRYFILSARGYFMFCLQRFWDLSCAPPPPVGSQRWNIDLIIVWDRVVTTAHAYSEISGFDFPLISSIFRSLLQSNAMPCLKKKPQLFPSRCFIVNREKSWQSSA
jgi:hypothetical protein